MPARASRHFLPSSSQSHTPSPRTKATGWGAGGGYWEGVGELFGAEGPRNEVEDRRGVGGGVVDETALCVRGDDEGRDPRSRSPAVAPAPARGRRHVVPVTAVLVVGQDHQHVGPLRALLEALEQLSDVDVAALDIGVARMLRQPAGRLVERHLRKLAAVDGGEEILAVFQVALAVRGARRESRVIVERLVVGLEVRAAGVPVVDDRALFFGVALAVGERLVPAARVPGP